MPNIDTKINVRYGAVLLNNLEMWVYDEIIENCMNLTCLECSAEFLNRIDNQLDENNFAEINACSECDHSEHTYSGEIDGIQLDMFVLGGAYHVVVKKSPHVVKCSLCSPCIPNAGDLDSKNPDGYDTYDLPDDWYYKGV